MTEYGTSPTPVRYNESGKYWEFLPYHAIEYNGLTLTNNNVYCDPSRDPNRSFKIEVYDKQSWLDDYDFEIYAHYDFDPNDDVQEIFTITNINKEDKSFIVNIGPGSWMAHEYIMHVAMVFFNGNSLYYLATATFTSCWD